MASEHEARAALTQWWWFLRGAEALRAEPTCSPPGPDVVRQFLLDKPYYQEDESDLVEWAGHQTWEIRKARWNAVRARSAEVG